MAIIRQLKKWITKENIYPQTVEQAVYDTEGNRLDNKILGIKNEITELNSQIPRVLYGNLYSSAVLRCTTLGTAVEKSFTDVDINNVNAIGVNVAIPDIGRHFCFLPKLSTDAGPRCCFSYLGTIDYYVYGYVEVDWKNKKIKFLIKSLKGWDISLIYASHIFLFQ